MQTMLTEEQVSAFDVDYMTDDLWQPIEQRIVRDFPGDFTFLDVGGGNGVFADRVLHRFPNAHGTVLEMSPAMVGKNVKRDRKLVVQGDAMQLPSYNLGSFDVIFCNWLLHHLVSTTYRKTRKNIVRMVSMCRNHLTERGRLSIYENCYNGVIDSAPGRLIFFLTSLRFAAPVMKFLGANTAGVGVSFLSSRQWEAILGSVETAKANNWRMSPLKTVPLLIKSVHCAHYWTAK